ncbi:hypothetical protein OK074_4323 [Actinobacteria bacterium OK074]|nr:hypothetical protein OK074_4323 [Actinobacteria bacterium OK074]
MGTPLLGTPLRNGLAGLLTCGALLATVTACDPDNDSSSAPPGTTAAAANPRTTPSRTPATTAPPADAAKGPYVALGDSYTAAPRVPDQDNSPAGCDRSSNNYPSVVARQLGLSGDDFTDVSCSGATTEDLTAAQSTDDGTNPAQLKALSDDTRFVTLGIGGNDIGFSDLIQSCVKQGLLYYATGSGKFTGETPCKDKYVSGSSDEITDRISTLGTQLAADLREIRDRAPEARIFVVGYPEILPPKSSETDGAADCGREMGLAPGDVTYLNQKERQLNEALRDRAKAAGVSYVDTYTPSKGLGACADRTTRWVEPLIPLNQAAPVHPNERGERGMANAVLKALKS